LKRCRGKSRGQEWENPSLLRKRHTSRIISDVAE
jgi:hypothetical protein